MNEQQNQDKRIALTQSIMSLLDDWSIAATDKISLLGLPDDVRARHMEHYRSAKAFPDTDTVNQHIEHIAGIADALRTMYPLNAGMGVIWLKQGHKRCDGRAPLSLMVDDGIHGLKRVRALVDCSYAWSVSDAI